MEDKVTLAKLASMTGTSVKPIDIVSGFKKPEIATISKLTRSRDGREKKLLNELAQQQMLAANLRTLAERDAVDQQDSQTILDTLPDLMLGADIQISSIINPKDTGNSAMRYNAEPGEIPAVAISTLNAATERICKQELKLEKNLSEWLMDILYKDGSKTILIIPENAVDDVINGSFSKESYDKLHREITTNNTFLKPRPDAKEYYTTEAHEKKTVSGEQDKNFLAYKDGKVSLDYVQRALENKRYATEANDEARTIYFDKKPTSIRFYDDPRYLTLSSLAEAERDLAVNRAYSREEFSFEDLKDKNPQKKRITASAAIDLFYKNPSTKRAGTVRLKTRDALNRPSVGEPIVRVIPACSFFPVTVPSNPNKRIGGIVVLGHNSEPLTHEDILMSRNLFNNTGTQSGASTHSTIQAINQAVSEPDEVLTNRRQYQVRRDAFSSAVEEQLLGALQRGMLGDKFELKYTPEIIDVMFFRQLNNMMTSMVFVPEQYMVYMAHRFDDAGRGVSVIKAMRNIISARCALVFGNMMAALRNAVPNLDVKVKLDPDDSAPLNTLALAQQALTQMRGDYSTLGIFSPDMIMDKLGRAGIRLLWEGHDELPDINVEYSDTQASIGRADADTEKMFADLTAQGQGLSPDVLDNARGADFAIQVAVNSTLRARRVATEQEKVNAYLTDLVRKYLSNSPKAFKELRDAIMPLAAPIKKALIAADKIEDNDKMTDEAVCSLTVILYLQDMFLELPKPDSTTIKNKMELVGDYEAYLDKILPFVIDSSLLTTNNFGTVASTVDELKAVVKGVMMRDFMAANNVGKELLDFVAITEDGKSAFDLRGKTDTFVLGMMKSVIPYLVSSRKIEAGIDALVAKYKIDLGESSSSSSSSSDDGSGDGSGSDGSDDAPDDDVFASFPDMGDETATADEGEANGTNADTKVQEGEVADTNQSTEEPENAPTPNKDDEVE